MVMAENIRLGLIYRPYTHYICGRGRDTLLMMIYFYSLERFRVKQGTKFYRVKCRQIQPPASDSLETSLAQSKPL